MADHTSRRAGSAAKPSGNHAGRRPGSGPHRRGARPRTTAALRRALRREVVGTIGVLADAHDFAAMRSYRSFVFDDHPSYLRQLDALLTARASDQLHTTVALFDPEDFAAFCSQHGLDPDTARGRGRYTATIAARGGAITYTGQPLDTLLPRLIDQAVRRATWEYATTLLAGLGACADCGQDIGRAAHDRASHLLTRLLEEAGPGRHHLVCSVQAPEEQLLAVLHADRDPTRPDAAPTAADTTEFVTVLATAIALGRPGGVVLRTSPPDAPDRLHGWRLHRSRLLPLTEAEVFSAYCTDAMTGEPLSPEPGVEYRAGFPVPTDDPEPHG
ncbi:hypothetical protein [Streptomyces sp. NPDC020965]|uniref:hypothetical protein n=1 Tax=Streptomyces sp. NPDC020965 TaxID=3365105 RepID=UPI0037A0BB71